jgi:3D (Asp-Asp-Asp) domain-containing protein
MNNRFTKLGYRCATLALGASLLVPALTANAAATTYTAKDSDTFWKMSKHLNIPLQQLLAANPNVDPLNIHAGLTIKLPETAYRVQSVFNSAVMLTQAEPAKRVQEVMTTSGQSLAFSKVLDIKATAYSSSLEENGKWGAVDFLGNELKLGTIAVDPKVIPLGTKVFVTGYDFSGLPTGGFVATANDIGSAIKGKRIDIFVPGSRSYVSGFGFQRVKVYVLK